MVSYYLPSSERTMFTLRKLVVALDVGRVSQHWMIRYAGGRFIALPSSSNPWDERQPFSPTHTTELAPVPGNYKYILGLPR
jgi:hypothetical protein